MATLDVPVERVRLTEEIESDAFAGMVRAIMEGIPDGRLGTIEIVTTETAEGDGQVATTERRVCVRGADVEGDTNG